MILLVVFFALLFLIALIGFIVYFMRNRTLSQYLKEEERKTVDGESLRRRVETREKVEVGEYTRMIEKDEEKEEENGVDQWLKGMNVKEELKV
jgi:hypothetical protein